MKRRTATVAAVPHDAPKPAKQPKKFRVNTDGNGVLTLGRRPGESVLIHADELVIEVVMVEIRGDRARLAFPHRATSILSGQSLRRVVSDDAQAAVDCEAECTGRRRAAIAAGGLSGRTKRAAAAGVDTASALDDPGKHWAGRQKPV